MRAAQIILNNGVILPMVGFGTWKIPEGEPIYSATQQALDVGYRAFDTATLYNNERGLARALRESGLHRNDYKITHKIWNSDQGYGKTRQAIDKALTTMQLDFIDVYLVHWPLPMYPDLVPETWRALEEAYEAGLIKAIGVSNFSIIQLQRLMAIARVPPTVNQFECHLSHQQPELFNFCQQHEIVAQAWRPLANGTLFEQPLVLQLAKKYHKTPAQIMLCYQVQRGLIVIPKSVHRERMYENIDIFDLDFTHSEMEACRALDTATRLGNDPDIFSDMIYQPKK